MLQRFGCRTRETMPRCSVCDDGAALLCGACVDAVLAASRARLAQARRAEADWKAQAEAAPARPPEIDVDAVAAGLAKTLLAVARRVHADRAQLRTARAANDATRRRVEAARRRLAKRRAELDALRSAIQAPSAVGERTEARPSESLGLQPEPGLRALDDD